ncbi:hypothetical protein E4K67_12925 [Desulfosporosinus fructosivorans]|uniref:Tail fiber protein n=1 Tax=Desulfosporosinus fructosivorans TaxID=2018669 RepID=A0A4Z0R6C0_9FIRM|nr:hypothetical protein [Desulfosporosinus fructosivorans]TGE37633.1 hypothetical protein E4K67_12925 [Desulfosporosinus fructosivorans]
MQTTVNLGLKKPEGTDVVNIQDFNDNADLLDNYAAATAILIGTKASIASPALTGTPTAPTAGVDTSTTQVATTAFVLGQAGTIAPIMNGTAGIGSSKRYARADHVHPADTSRAGQVDLVAHLADYVRQPGYAVTTGPANAYIVTLDPAPSAYVDGMGITVRINTTSTGAITFNVNGLGAKAVVDSKGNAFSSTKVLLAGSRYTLRYSTAAGNFQLQGEGGEYGTALASQVLTGYSIGSDSGLVNGTMPNRAGDTAALASSVSGTTLKLRASNGYRDGVDDNVMITDADFMASNILAGKNIFGVDGSVVTGIYQYTPGSQILYSDPNGGYDSNGVTNGETEVARFTIPAGVGGTVTICYTSYINSGSISTALTTVRKNGVDVYSYANHAGFGTALSFTTAVSPGDIISFHINVTSSPPSSSTSISGISVKVGNLPVFTVTNM